MWRLSCSSNFEGLQPLCKKKRRHGINNWCLLKLMKYPLLTCRTDGCTWLLRRRQLSTWELQNQSASLRTYSEEFYSNLNNGSHSKLLISLFIGAAAMELHRYLREIFTPSSPYLLSTTQFVDLRFPWNLTSLECRKVIPLTISLIRDILLDEILSQYQTHQSTQYIIFSFPKMNGVWWMIYFTFLSYLKSMSSSNSWSSKISWREPFEQYSVMRNDCSKSKQGCRGFESVFCYSETNNEVRSDRLSLMLFCNLGNIKKNIATITPALPGSREAPRNLTMFICCRSFKVFSSIMRDLVRGVLLISFMATTFPL